MENMRLWVVKIKMRDTKAFLFWTGFSCTLLIGTFIKIVYVSVDKYDYALVLATLYCVVITLIMASLALKENNK